MSPTNVSPTESPWMLRPLYNLSLGLVSPDRCIPTLDGIMEANSLRQGKLGDVWPASPIGSCPSVRCKHARPTHYNSQLLPCSAGGHSSVTLLKVFRDGMVRSGAQYPRDALSKGCNIQEFSMGDTPVGDEITLHPSD